MIQYVLALSVTGALLIAGCAKKETSQPQVTHNPIAVTIQQVATRPFTEYSTYYARLEPFNEAQIVCYSGGRVEKLSAQEGSWVKQGASLASIDSDKASSLLETAKLQEKIAKLNLDQTKRHFQDGNASQLAVDQAELGFLSAQNNRIDAEKNYRGALGITPISGQVTRKFVNSYQELPPGSPLFTVAQNGTMKVKIDLLESDVANIKIGTTAEMTLDIYPGKTWQGKIKYIAPAASPESKKFPAEIHIDNKDGLLKAGLTGRVRLELQHLDEAVVVPIHVVLTEGVRSSVMVVDSQNKARKRYIEPGSQSDNMLLVKSGLQKGEVLIVGGQNLVADGAPVVTSEAKSSSQDGRQ